MCLTLGPISDNIMTMLVGCIVELDMCLRPVSDTIIIMTAGCLAEIILREKYVGVHCRIKPVIA